LEELEKDPRIQQKIKRFRNKQAQMKHIFTEVCLPKHAAVCSFKVKTWKVIKYNYDVKAEIHADNFVQVFHL